jgi:hypothetical protein
MGKWLADNLVSHRGGAAGGLGVLGLTMLSAAVFYLPSRRALAPGGLEVRGV